MIQTFFEWFLGPDLAGFLFFFLCIFFIINCIPTITIKIDTDKW